MRAHDGAIIMPNIVSFSDINEQKEDQESVFSFTGGLKSGIQVENNSSDRPRTVELYKDGFIVDGGEFRSLEDPENKKFIREIQQGIAPKELHGGNNEICIQLVDHQSIPFPGKQSKTKNTPLRERRFEKYSKVPGKTRTVNIKLYTGESISLEISESASINDLFDSINSLSGLNTQQYILLADYPPKQITYPPTVTLSSTDLFNTIIIQRKTN
ncbi:ubiquitin regulatory protein, putative [Babesia microti strain RI]|uniref:Ubiquitin regulatory protein, putative n=1 Tax=Babesia microti (strain RI) TaxID=1133968 RepID=A0A1R4AC35_BABMR|nr:ubiquitin regulatory protein, putative [Babesia microti strain RI]SJK86505.1 ubiquitin regulatory protein, putative [Babesia microti strain RI]|eukprot:XP_021338657.1 ubiquitin regulatory protein, putative [Babesia microti strain RI]